MVEPMDVHLLSPLGAIMTAGVRVMKIVVAQTAVEILDALFQAFVITIGRASLGMEKIVITAPVIVVVGNFNL